MPPPPPMPPIANAPRMGLLGQQLMTPPKAPITPRGSTRGKTLSYILITLYVRMFLHFFRVFLIFSAVVYTVEVVANLESKVHQINQAEF